MPPKRTKKKALSPANESRVNELEQFLFTNVEDLFEKRKQAIDEFIIRGSAELYQTISHIVSQVSLDAFFCDLFDKKENDPAQTGGPTRKKSSSRTNSSAINVNVPCTTRKEVKQEEPDSNERKTRSVRDSVRAKNGQLPVHQDTVLRAPGTSRMPHSLAVQTPFGVRNVNLPMFITPRVDGNADKCQLTGRVMRADEIAFSVTGSPVVAPPATPAPEQQLLHQVLNMPETELSPDTRQIAVAIKTLVKKKAQTGE